jgi:hypothetical protein
VFALQTPASIPNINSFQTFVFKMSLDPHVATPPKLLHLVLLGDVKHIVKVSFNNVIFLTEV